MSFNAVCPLKKINKYIYILIYQILQYNSLINVQFNAFFLSMENQRSPILCIYQCCYMASVFTNITDTNKALKLLEMMKLEN